MSRPLRFLNSITTDNNLISIFKVSKMFLVQLTVPPIEVKSSTIPKLLSLSKLTFCIDKKQEIEILAMY